MRPARWPRDADRVLDGDGGVDAVLVVEVDVAGVEAAEAGLAAGAHVLGRAAHGHAAGGALPYPELGGHLHLLPRQLLERLPQEGLVGVGPVGVGGVEEGDPAAEGVRDDGGDGLVAERRVVGAREPHAPEPQLRHLHPCIARWSVGIEPSSRVSSRQSTEAQREREERGTKSITSSPWVPSLTRGTCGRAAGSMARAAGGCSLGGSKAAVLSEGWNWKWKGTRLSSAVGSC